MKKLPALAMIAAPALVLAACSPAAQNETAEAADTIAADANATMSEAISDTNAAAESAFGSAEATMDNVASDVGNGADTARDDAADTLQDAGNAIEN